MKKVILSLALIAASVSASMQPAFADGKIRTASATASWDAKAIKDTKSILVVTPLKSLTFNYADGLKSFNTQDGAFDVTIAGQTGATDFKLTSQIISNTLTRASDGSALTVGVKWNGKDLTDNTPTTMVDTKGGISSGLEALANSAAYAGAGRTSAIGTFTFNIKSASENGKAAAFADLSDGYWDGNVNVKFTATWDGEFTKAIKA